MKQGNLAISFEEEKLAALRRYMGKKEPDLEAELTDAPTKLYEEYVPAPVKKKDLSYKEVTEKARQVMRELISQMENSVCDSSAIAQMMAQLSKELGGSHRQKGVRLPEEAAQGEGGRWRGRAGALLQGCAP